VRFRAKSAKSTTTVQKNEVPEVPRGLATDDPAECPICGTIVDAFLPGGHPSRLRPDAMCPKCQSLERHRAFWLCLLARTKLLSAPLLPEPLRVLHIGPENSIRKRIQTLPNVDYLSGDLVPGKAMVVIDLTDIDRPDESFDIIIASHVIEHIPDDVAAMREMRRVLKRCGQGFFAVPQDRAASYEDDSIIEPADRLKHFGQEDHVRVYGQDGLFERRLSEAGFDVSKDPILRELDPRLIHRYRIMKDEPMFVCTWGTMRPSAPTMLRNAVAGDGTATMSWLPPEGDDLPLTGYEVTAYDGYFPELSVRFQSVATTQTIGGLKNGATYRFKVAAMNQAGVGVASMVSNPVVPGPA
jgi:SAM-dependent methyltransferase